MKKYDFIFSFLLIKKYLLSLVIILCLLKEIQLPFFQVFHLTNRYFVWVNTDRILRLNSTSYFLPDSVQFSDSQKLNINDTDELELVRFSEYLDDFGYLIVAVKHYFYLLDNEGVLICQKELPIFQGYNVSVISYKCFKESNIIKCHFIVAYVNKESKIGIYRYKITNVTNNCEYEMVSNLIYTPVNSLEKETISNCKTLTCQVASYNCEDVLTCFYENKTPNELVAINFNITNDNITILNKRSAIFKSNDGCQQIESSLALNKTKILICYINNNNECHCLFYDTLRNRFERDQKVFDYCLTTSRYLFENRYFGPSKEYILGCYSTLNTYNFKRFDLNFNLLSFNNSETCVLSFKNLYNCNEIDSSSLYYSTSTGKNYRMMVTCDDNDTYYYPSINQECGLDLNYIINYNKTVVCEIYEKEEVEEEEKLEKIEEEEYLEKVEEEKEYLEEIEEKKLENSKNIWKKNIMKNLK